MSGRAVSEQGALKAMFTGQMRLDPGSESWPDALGCPRCPAAYEHLEECVGCHGGAVQVALISMAILKLEKGQLLGGLHAFGNQFELQAAGHGDDGADNLGVVAVLGTVTDKRLVDLQ